VSSSAATYRKPSIIYAATKCGHDALTASMMIFMSLRRPMVRSGRSTRRVRRPVKFDTPGSMDAKPRRTTKKSSLFHGSFKYPAWDSVSS
jgi:hypothetical protein